MGIYIEITRCYTENDKPGGSATCPPWRCLVDKFNKQSITPQSSPMALCPHIHSEYLTQCISLKELQITVYFNQWGQYISQFTIPMPQNYHNSMDAQEKFNVILNSK
jgi:hypothetical protein